MLTLRFETEDGCEHDWKRQSLAPASGLHSLKRSRPRAVSSCSLECGADKASLEGCCICGQKSNLCHVENPIEDDVEGGAFLPNYDCTVTSDALEFPFGGDFEADDEDFDLGPPPPSGPVLVRQKAMDFTAAREAKGATLAQKLDPRASMNPSAALRSTRLSSSSSALNRRGLFGPV